MKVLLNNNIAETLGDAGAIAFNSTKHYMNEHKQVETPDFVDDFMFNYNFKEYNPETKTVPNTMGASFQQDLVLRGTPVVGKDHITITSGDAYSQVSFASTSANPFNRNSTKGKELTFIYKVGGDSKDKSTLFCNRGRDATGGTGDYNWMIFVNSGATFLHKAQSGIAQLTVTTKPAIYCITNDASNKTTNKCLTTQASATGTSEYGNDSARITFFCSSIYTPSPIILDEKWSGDCYWMFCANRVLTQEEIQRVINYNENIITSEIQDGSYISFTTTGASQTVSLPSSGGNAPSIQYSYDKQNWTTWDYSALSFGTGATSGNTVYIRGMNPEGFTKSESVRSRFTFGSSTPLVECAGNIMSLVNYETLPTTIPNTYCFYGLFSGCRSLLTAPALPATALTSDCYRGMFSECSSLVTAPALPATALTSECYFTMFYGCYSLTTAPALPATALASSCYRGMFQACSGLTAAPALPATTLTDYCYRSMFYECANLVTAPALPATTLTTQCYYSMFGGCTKLNYIKCLATSVSAADCTTNWVSGVASTGTFVCPQEMSTWTRGVNGVPTNWTIIKEGTTPWVSFTTTGASQTVRLTNEGSNAPSLAYSYDKQNWTTWNYSALSFGTGATSGNTVYIRGTNTSGFSKSSTVRSRFTFGSSTPLVECKGNIMSLINYQTLPTTIPNTYCLAFLFSGCTSLKTAPELPATTLAQYCYYYMFNGCTSLTTAPALPATALASNCYSNMFSDCTSLKTAPELPATTLAGSCYLKMFQGCTKLNYIKCLATNISASGCTANWVSGVASTGTFVCPQGMSAWSSGASGVPSGWTIQRA